MVRVGLAGLGQVGLKARMGPVGLARAEAGRWLAIAAPGARADVIAALRDKMISSSAPYLRPGEPVQAVFGAPTTSQWGA
jgi:hypothetical protein